VEEYFISGDVANVAQSLEELGAPASMSHYFVKRLVTLALDRKGREREMASVLLSGLYGEVSWGARSYSEYESGTGRDQGNCSRVGRGSRGGAQDDEVFRFLPRVHALLLAC
jgi:hypothetical protein